MSSPVSMAAAPDFLKMRLCATARALLVEKASAVVIGITLKNVITVTVISIIMGDMSSGAAVGGGFDPKSEKEAYVTFMTTVITFLGIVTLAVVLAKVVNGVDQIPDRLKKGYTAGIVLIPAWSWKDVVAAAIALYTFLGYLGAPWTYVVFAILNAMVCATIQMILEIVGKNFEPGTFVHAIIQALMACYALGVGYGVDTAVRMCVGPERFLEFQFTCTYVIVMLAIVPVLQNQVATRLTPEVRAETPVIVVKGLDFLVQSGGFVLGWAFKGLFDTLFEWQMNAGLWFPGQCQASLLVTTIGVFSSVVVALSPAPQAYVDLTNLVMGLNIGWTWMIFANKVLAAQGEAGGLAKMWANSIVVMLIVILVGLGMEHVLGIIESVKIFFVKEYRLFVMKLGGEKEIKWSKVGRLITGKEKAKSYGATSATEKADVDEKDEV